jgi:hypothetical protein
LKNGVTEIIKCVDNLTKDADASTKTGRDLLKAKDELLTRLVYSQRSVEE